MSIVYSELKRAYLKNTEICQSIRLVKHKGIEINTLNIRHAEILARICHYFRLESIDISTEFSGVSSIIPTDTSCVEYYYKKIGTERELEVVFFCDDYRVVVEMSKYVKITGLVCIGLPGNLEWIKDMKCIPKYLVLCGERYGLKKYKIIDSMVVGYFYLLEACVSNLVPYTTGFGVRIKNMSNSWKVYKKHHVSCTVYFTQDGNCFIVNYRKSVFFWKKEDVSISVNFIKDRLLINEEKTYTLEDIFSVFYKEDYLPIVDIFLYFQKKCCNSAQETSYLNFLDYLSEKTAKNKIVVHRTDLFLLTNHIHELYLRVRLITPIYVVPYSTHIDITDVETSSCVILNPSTRCVIVKRQSIEKKVVHFKGECKNIRKFVCYNAIFDWDNNMKENTLMQNSNFFNNKL